MAGCSCTRVCRQEIFLPGLTVRVNDSPAPGGLQGCVQLLPSPWGYTSKFYATFYILFVAPHLNCTGLVMDSWAGMAITADVWFPPQKCTPEPKGIMAINVSGSVKYFSVLSLGACHFLWKYHFSQMQMSHIAFSQFIKLIYTMKLNCTDLSKFICSWFNFPLQGIYTPSCELIKSASWTICVLANQLMYFQSLLIFITYFKSW